MKTFLFPHGSVKYIPARPAVPGAEQGNPQAFFEVKFVIQYTTQTKISEFEFTEKVSDFKATVSIPVEGASQDYSEIEKKAADLLPEMLRELAHEIQVDIDRVNGKTSRQKPLYLTNKYK